MAQFWKRGSVKPQLEEASSSRFSVECFRALVSSGWQEGRRWDEHELKKYLRSFEFRFPNFAVEILLEFGGLDIGQRGRLVSFGYIDDWLLPSYEEAKSFTGKELFPVGRTNRFEDDGLGVLVDREGQIYVNGPTGSDPPCDHRLDSIAEGFDGFLSTMFIPGRISIRESWNYTLYET
ncbi:SUKH-3 domain-containing protein [Roseibacillus persicicus]|uniref:SUKH-3 domain-containing protein n=1 Tax=Roseibacillus persicicus TaxID=454148 RepID=UPI00280FEC66|nr:SUKH-3 domain-containing protein [Roseibacillus persicicus]MDQ8192729.1 SUKH-3 domain-containing protein [Roseibacillus persicicus]